MKKKFIVGAIVAAGLLGCSTLTSCKDNNEDVRIETSQQYNSLKAALEKLQAQLALLADCPQKCQEKINELQNQLNNKVDKSEYDSLVSQIEQLYLLKSTFESFQTTVNNNLTSILNRLDALEGQKNPFEGIDPQDLKDLIALKAQLQGLFGSNGVLAGLQGQLTTLDGKITGLEGTVNGMQTSINDLNTAVGNINSSLTNINNSIDGINTTLGGLNTALAGVIGNVQTITTTIETIQGAISTINTTLTGMQGQIDDLKKWFEGIGITPEQFQDYVKQGEFIKVNKAALDALVKLQNEGLLNEDALKALNSVYQNLEGINNMYETIFKDVEAPEGGWWNYAEVINKIKENSAAISELQKDRDIILGRLNDMVTSLLLQATHNRVFGGVNTPFGFNSMVLMTLYGERTTGLDYFPLSGRGAECNNEDYDDIDWSALTSDKVELGRMICETDENNQASLGTLWFTVNPGTVNNIDKEGFAIVNSKDEDPVVAMTNITKDDETVLKFGVSSRAAGKGNGLYQANVTVNPDELYKIKINIEHSLTTALKDAVKNHTGSDMTHLAKALYNQLTNVCDANALRYTYEAYTDKNADGTWNKSAQKVYSNYGLAATAFKPLSFATLKGSSFSQRVPTISPISISKDLVKLDLGTFNINQKNFNLSFEFGEPEFDAIGNLTVTTHVILRDVMGNPVEGDVTINITDEANKIQQQVIDSIKAWLNADGGIESRLDEAVWYAMFNGINDPDPKYPYNADLPKGVVTSLLDQVDDKLGNIQDKLYDLVDKINNDYLNKVNTLIDKYNTVAEHINNMLSNPNHYLQVTMLYKKAGKIGISGHTPEVELPFGLLSTNPKQPTQFRGAGEAIRLWATTYNFEVLCPAYKKIVAVTKVTDAQGKERKDLKDAANATLAKVMNGDKQQVALNVAGATNGTYTYEIAYQAVDYSGFTSTVKCYIQVIR